MNYLGNELVYLEDERVNRSPDRVDRYTPSSEKCNEKICRPDRYVGKKHRFV